MFPISNSVFCFLRVFEASQACDTCEFWLQLINGLLLAEWIVFRHMFVSLKKTCVCKHSLHHWCFPSGSKTLLWTPSMEGTPRQSAGCWASSPSVPSLTVAAPTSTCRSSAMMTSGCQSWSGPRRVAITRSGTASLLSCELQFLARGQGLVMSAFSLSFLDIILCACVLSTHGLNWKGSLFL